MAQTAYAAAGNSGCPHGGNPTASACFFGDIQDSDTVQFHSNMMTMNAAYITAGNHVNQTLWTYTGDPCDLWVEQGITEGYHGANEYGWYYAANTTDGYFDEFLGTTTANGSNHSYENEWVGGDQFDQYRDGALIAETYDLSPGICIASAGIEDTVVSTYSHSDTFDFMPITWTNTGGGAENGWGPEYYWNDYPCGGGYSTPNCFNGVWYSTSYWADNKP